MNVEQAIEQLEGIVLIDDYDTIGYALGRQAIDLAIAALKKQEKIRELCEKYIINRESYVDEARVSTQILAIPDGSDDE
jgi:RIO-like serine/threonine protein kinase